MADQSDFMKNRLKNNNEQKTIVAKNALIGVGAVYGAIGIFMLIGGVTPTSVGNIMVAGVFIALGLMSDRRQVLVFQISFGLSLLFLVISIIGFRILAVVIFGLLAHRVYLGIEAAKYLESLEPDITDDDILDADMRQD